MEMLILIGKVILGVAIGIPAVILSLVFAAIVFIFCEWLIDELRRYRSVKRVEKKIEKSEKR